ncbi:cytochrome c [Xanthocytophaga flavus]|uniref:c-type cytochrome n=1 Tax=Xanthocytophaga flava TaxID=3048013 RepID=UPI0028D556C3|nr:cytochrome c [Xanthocytophaga flavus]
MSKYTYIVFVASLCLGLVHWACSRPGVQTAAHTAVNTERAKDSVIIDSACWPESFSLGHVATEAEIQAWDIDVRPDGKGLPAGSGNFVDGQRLYAAKCAVCHGKTGKEGPNNQLVGGADVKEKTIGNYWPYSTTLFDYIRRAMPFNQPGSLSDKEVYSLTAFLLAANRIIDSTTVINAETLPKIQMPAQKYFVPDDRKGGAEVR